MTSATRLFAGIDLNEEEHALAAQVWSAGVWAKRLAALMDLRDIGCA